MSNVWFHARQASLVLLKMAKTTSDPDLAAGLVRAAADTSGRTSAACQRQGSRYTGKAVTRDTWLFRLSLVWCAAAAGATVFVLITQ